MEPVCSPITRPSSSMQLIAGLYKGLFISQRATKGALSKFSLGLLNHHSRQDQQSITSMCQNTASFPQTHLLHPSISPQWVRGDGWHVPAQDRAAHAPCPGMGGDLLGQDISGLEHPARNADVSSVRPVETHPAPPKCPTSIRELVEHPWCDSWTAEAAARSRYPAFLLQTREGQACPISPDLVYLIKTQSTCDSSTVIVTLPPHQIMWPRKQVLIVSLSLPGDVTLEKFPNIACSHFPFSTAEIITVHGCRRTSFIHICFWYLRLSKSSQEEDQQRTSSFHCQLETVTCLRLKKKT